MCEYDATITHEDDDTKPKGEEEKTEVFVHINILKLQIAHFQQ